MPAAIVFEGELTWNASRVPTSGVDNCIHRGGNRATLGHQEACVVKQHNVKEPVWPSHTKARGGKTCIGCVIYKG